ncbi:MAG: type I methionyl aminopeptidase, partial [Candidatus Zambryskibacteria bacterium RIFCSPHIGHO2_12_FULL_44_12b]
MITYKTPEDIEILKEGGKRHADILGVLVSLVFPGQSTNVFNGRALKLIHDSGDVPAFLRYRPEGAKRPYPAAVCVSLNEEIVHGIPNENPKILKEGDIVTLDLGLRHRGLVTDMAVTVPVGEVSAKDQLLIEATEAALSAGVVAAQCGFYIGDIGFAIESVAKKYGFKVVEGLAGHGVGYEVHEDPYVPNTGKPGRGEELKLGMVLAIEP